MCVCVWSYTSLSCITGPEWASYTLGVFVCQSCSGLHRNIAQISKVKSLILDPWSPSELEVRNPVEDPLFGKRGSAIKLKMTSHSSPTVSSYLSDSHSSPCISAWKNNKGHLYQLSFIWKKWASSWQTQPASLCAYAKACLCIPLCVLSSVLNFKYEDRKVQQSNFGRRVSQTNTELQTLYLIYLQKAVNTNRYFL